MTKYKTNKAIIYDQFGIDVLCARKLKQIISPTGNKQFTGQEILICDKENAYGIIILNEPMILDDSLFKNHFSRHVITEEGREAMWPGVTKFNAFSFRIKKIFKEPLEFVYIGEKELATGEFVKGITIKEENIEYTDAEEAAILLKYEEKLEAHKAAACKEEDIEMKTLFIELYELFAKRLAEKDLEKTDA